MKRMGYISLIFALFFLSCIERNNPETNIIEVSEIDVPAIQNLNIIKFVNAPAGLNVRNSPNINSDRIGALMDLTEVLVIREDGITFNIDGVDGKWTLIETNSIEGWVFGGFLSSEPLRVMEQNLFSQNIGITPQKTIDDIMTNYIFPYLNSNFNFDNRHNFNESNTFEGLLSGLQISRGFRIAEEFSWESIHGNIVTTYVIEYGSFSFTVWDLVYGSNRYRLNSVRIYLDEEGEFLNLFPYRTMEEFIGDEGFGRVEFHGDDFICYVIGYSMLWALNFDNGELKSISWEGFIP